MILYPNSKINIGLHIVNKRMDGYHDIESIFYPITKIYDILEILPSKDFTFSTTGINIGQTENICIKAFKLFKKKYDIPNVKIHLHKMIPIGAGLGGGSSDGAFTLLALNKIFNLNLSFTELESYALILGSDCPFFIRNEPKYVEGIGDKMTSVALDLSSYEIKFIFPKLHISTKDAYSNVSPFTRNISLYNSITKPIVNWKDIFYNDFENTIFQRNIKLKEIKQTLYSEGAIYASMTGSGSALYGIFQK